MAATLATQHAPLQPFANATLSRNLAGVTTPAPMKLEHVIARAMAELRLERAWTQTDLARRMSSAGVNWTPNRVTQLETLRRPVSLFEVVALAWVFEVPVTRLLAGEQAIEAPDGVSIVPLANIRAALAGDTSRQEAERKNQAESQQRQQVYLDEIRKLAKTLGVEPQVMEWVARRLYGHPFIDERETRLGDVSGLTPGAARTKRGHVTRALLNEMRDHLDREDREKIAAAFRTDMQQKAQEMVGKAASLIEAGEAYDLDAFMTKGRLTKLDLQENSEADE